MKKFLFIAMLVFVGLYFAFKNKDMTDFQKAIGNPAANSKKTQSELIAEKEKPNKYNAGDCLKVSSSSDWEVFKIVKVDLDKKDYQYRLCVKFKGCQKEVITEIITNFEYDFPPTRKTKCLR
jgi:hypothetical protein